MGKLEVQKHGGALYRPAKGETPNPAGKPKGAKHLSTYIQELMEDKDFTVYLQHPTKGYEEYKGVPIKAIVMVAILRAAAGDKDAREWLAKYGYGSRVEVDLTDPRKAILTKYGLDDNAGQTQEA